MESKRVFGGSYYYMFICFGRNLIKYATYKTQKEGKEKQKEREMEGEKGKVCVTGGTGFIASWLVMKLLQHGYSVNTTIRSHLGM